jgi:hypothetical protein
MELRNFMFPKTDFSEVRASSLGNSAETAALLGKASMIDLRKLGCPDSIFEFVLEKRAERRSVESRGSDIDVPDNHRDAMNLQMTRALRA